jgi:pilus assembly protein CpaE
VIAAPDTLRSLPSIHPDMIRNLINVLKTEFAYIILDLPHLWTNWSAEAMAQSDRVVMVSQLWLRSLTHLSRLLNASQEMGIDKDKIWLAVNRSGARFREAITPQDFERVCLKTINFYFANDIKTAVNAENQGKTALEVGSSLLERQLREAARTLYSGGSGRMQAPAAGVPVAAEGSEKAASRKGLRGLFNK